MKILIDDITSKPLHVAREISPEEYGPELVLLKKAKIDLEIMKKGRKASISGSVRARVELTCSRCLEKFPFDVEAEHALEYRPGEECADEENVRLRKDELSVIYYSEPVISLYEDIRQTIHLGLPLKPVCSAGCRGLCPSCGANLNSAECGCEERAVDPRFEQLKRLKGL